MARITYTLQKTIEGQKTYHSSNDMELIKSFVNLLAYYKRPKLQDLPLPYYFPELAVTIIEVKGLE